MVTLLKDVSVFHKRNDLDMKGHELNMKTITVLFDIVLNRILWRDGTTRMFRNKVV